MPNAVDNRRLPLTARIRSTNPFWALAAALGATYLVVGLALAVRELALPRARELEMALTNRTIYVAGIPDSILLALGMGVGTAVGAFVAGRANGLRAVVLFGGLVAGAAMLFVADAIAREQRLRTSECCWVATVGDVPLAAAAMFVPALLGVVAGAVLARRGVTHPGRNAGVEAAGTYAIIGAIAVLALLPSGWFLLAPYGTVALEPTAHALTVIAQSVVAATVYVLRGGIVGVRAVALVALMGLVGVAYADLLEIWYTLFLDHHYVPVSLIAVPVASAVLAAAILLVATLTRRLVGPSPSS